MRVLHVMHSAVASSCSQCSPIHPALGGRRNNVTQTMCAFVHSRPRAVCRAAPHTSNKFNTPTIPIVRCVAPTLQQLRRAVQRDQDDCDRKTFYIVNVYVSIRCWQRCYHEEVLLRSERRRSVMCLRVFQSFASRTMNGSSSIQSGKQWMNGSYKGGLAVL